MRTTVTFPSKADIDRIMAFESLQPITGETADERATRERDCRAAVAAVLRELREYNTTPVSKVRQQAGKYASKLRSASAALVKLDRLLSALPYEHDLQCQRQAEELDRLRQQVDGFLNDMAFRAAKPAVARTRLAARRAFHLLMDFWNITPTTTQGGAWHELTELLCEIAIGPKGRRDALRACRWGARSHPSGHGRRGHERGRPAASALRRPAKEGEVG
jgi:hypothetical protein